MKIGIYDPYLDTMSGGEKYMLTAALMLAKEHDVSVFWNLADKDSIIKKAKDRFGMDLGSLTFAESIFRQNVSTASRYLQSKNYDAIFLLSDGSIPLLASDLYVHFQSPMEWVSLTPITKLKVKRIKKIVCNSEFTKKYIDRKFHVKSLVITPPVIVQREYTKSKKEKRILHVGRFGVEGNGSSYKKQDILAAVFSDMVEKGLKDWKLVFVMGVMEQDKHVVQEFEKQYRNLPVEFIVNPTNDELWREYEKASIYWHASGFGEDLERHPDRAEHFGISTVEAMGAGAVPVVFAAGGQKEIITAGENGLFWESEKELAEITLDLIKNHDKREKVANHAAKRAGAYSIDVFGQKIRDLVT